MILPQYQKYGYGRFLIEFSYLLSQQEDSLGTPEKPLSDLGKISYLNYWRTSILKVIKDKKEISIREISEATHMTPNDIILALKESQMLIKNPDEKTPCIYIFKNDLDKLNKPRLTVKPEDLRWTKYVSHLLPRVFGDDDEEQQQQQQQPPHQQEEQGDVEDEEEEDEEEECLSGIKQELEANQREDEKQVYQQACDSDGTDNEMVERDVNVVEDIKRECIDHNADDGSDTTSILSDVEQELSFTAVTNSPTSQEHFQVT